MPLYTYRCNENGHEFEARQRMMDDPLTECPVCGGPVRRVVSSVGVVFKGSGFYVTDNRSSGVNGKGTKSRGKEGKESNASSEGGSTSDSGAKTESGSTTTPKPAAPAE